MDLLERIFRVLQANLHSGQEMSIEDIEYWLRRSRYGDLLSDDAEPNQTEGSTNGRRIDPELAGYYANLEIPYGADLHTARYAWKVLLKKYHPDLHSGDPQRIEVANRITAELNKAYQNIETALGQEDNR